MHTHTNTHQALNGMFVTELQCTLIVQPDAVLSIHMTHFFYILGETLVTAFCTDVFLNSTHILRHVNTKTKRAARMHTCWLANAEVSQQANVTQSFLVRLPPRRQKKKKRN